jgi:hypothetical protein
MATENIKTEVGAGAEPEKASEAINIIYKLAHITDSICFDESFTEACLDIGINIDDILEVAMEHLRPMPKHFEIYQSGKLKHINARYTMRDISEESTETIYCPLTIGTKGLIMELEMHIKIRNHRKFENDVGMIIKGPAPDPAKIKEQMKQ